MPDPRQMTMTKRANPFVRVKEAAELAEEEDTEFSINFAGQKRRSMV